MYFDFTYKLFNKISHFKKTSVRKCRKYTKVLMRSMPYSRYISLKFEFFNEFQKNTQISSFMKIRPVGAEFFHVDRRTRKYDEANSRFSEFCESLNNRCSENQ